MPNRLYCLIGALLMALLFACGLFEGPGDERQPEGIVTGTVMYRPGYDAMPIMSGDPPTLRAQEGVRVYLIRPSNRLKRQITQADIVVESVTDSLGRYQMYAPVGKLYLGLYHDRCDTWVTGLADGTVIQEFPLCRIKPISVYPDSTVELVDSLYGLVTM